MTSYSFTKRKRLLNPRDYSTVFGQKAIKVSSRQFLLLATPLLAEHLYNPNCKKKGLSPEEYAKEAESIGRLGLVIAKKHVPTAVARNQIKRVARERFRLNQHQLKSLNIVVLSKVGAGKLSKAELHIMFTQLFEQLSSRADKLLRKQKQHSSQNTDNN